MRYLLALLLLVSLLLHAQQQNSVAGRWILNADFYGTPLIFQLEMKQQGDKVTGDFGGDKLEGTVSGNAMHFLAKDESGGSEELKGTIQGDTLTGTIVFVDGGNPSRPATHAFTAKMVPPPRPGPPRTP